MPVVGLILAAGAVIVLTMAVTARKNREVTERHVTTLSYWGLERSQAQIRTRNFAPIAIHVIIASIIVAAGSRYADGYQQGTTLYLALGGYFGFSYRYLTPWNQRNAMEADNSGANTIPVRRIPYPSS